MSRKISIAICAVLLPVLINGVGFAYEANPTTADGGPWLDQNDYSIVQGQPVIDGVISPGEWDNAQWINIGGNVYGGGTWPNCNPNDLTNVMWANLWSPETNLIYVAVQGTDTSHNFGTYVSWNTQDDLEVYVDAGQSNLYWYHPDFRYGQHYFIGPDGGGGAWVRLSDQPADALMPGGYAVGVDGDVITYEFAITPYEQLDLATPGNSIIRTLEAGDVVGLDLCMVTADVSQTTTFMCEHSKPVGLWKDASHMLDLTLVGAMSKAYNESPSDGQIGVDTTVVLSWKPGDSAAFHEVYFGTNGQEVADANTSDSTGIYRDTIDVNSYPVGETLDLGRTYYWRIDEVNDADPCSPWKGSVWSFTVYIMGNWTFECPRSEVAPEYWQDSQVLYDGQPTLALAGGGKSYAIGKWVQTVAVSPDTNYQFTTYFRTEDVQDIQQCVLSRVYWQNSSGGDIGEHGSNVDFPPILRVQTPDGWYVMTGKYKSPSTAAKAKLELYYRFDADGSVHFGGTELVAIPAPPARKVKVGTVYYRATGPTTAANLVQYAVKVAEAAALGAEIMCLPEGMTSIGTGLSSVGASESVPGPSTDYLGTVAQLHGIYIVGDVFERVGEAVYNTAVLIDPNGDLVGTFRKTCLPREESDGGIAPGDSYPVFDTDFGRIGIMICWDNQFPVPARMLTLAGAEIIFFPNWGGTMECTVARALENQVYIVSSTNSSSPDMESAVFNRQGEIIVQATKGTDPTKWVSVVTELDLDQREYLWWLGDYRNRRLREMPFTRAGGVLRTADLDADDEINILDFAAFADSWLVQGIH